MVTFADADWRAVNMEKASREIQKAGMYLITAQRTNTWHFRVINTLDSEYIYIKMQGKETRGRTFKYRCI